MQRIRQASDERWSDLLRLDPSVNTALYIQLADRIRAAIEQKQLSPGEKLPVSKEMQRISGLSSITVENGISILVREGWVIRRPRYGTFVVEKTPRTGDRLRNRQKLGVVRVVFHQIYPYGEYWFRLLLSLETELRRAGFRMEFWQMNNEFTFGAQELEEGCAALIFCGTCPALLVRDIVQDDFPLLLLGSLDRPQAVPAGVDMLMHDDRQSAFEAMNHLLKLGHREIGCITAPAGTQLHQDYLTGIRQAAEEFKLDPSQLHIVSMPIASLTAGNEAVKPLLCNHTGITALLSTDSLVTCGIRNALTELGLRIPEEISLITLGESTLFSFLRPALTTVRSQEPPGGFVVKAVEILMERLQNPSHLRKIVHFGTPQVMVRESTRFLRHAAQEK